MLMRSRNCPATNRTERVRAAAERIELRANRCLAENRDLTERERQLCTADRDELHALHNAEAIREHAERTRKAIGEAIENTPRPETRGRLETWSRWRLPSVWLTASSTLSSRRVRTGSS